MTCLASAAASLGLTRTMVSTAMEQLSDRWIALGFDGAAFLAGEALQRSLAALSPAQHRQLLVTILGLSDDLRLCRELQAAMEHGLIEPTADRSLLRLVTALQPVLACQVPHGRCVEQRLAPAVSGAELGPEFQHDISRLGLTLRLENALRRNRIQQVSDLIGLQEDQLLRLRGVGATGLTDLRTALERLELPFPLVLAPGAACTSPPAEPASDPATDERWLERAVALIGPADVEVAGAARMLEELASLTLEHFSDLGHRQQELEQLNRVFAVIRAASDGSNDHQLLADGLLAALLAGYRLRVAVPGQASGWLQQLQRAVTAPQAVESFLRYATGETLQAIGAAADPPITREAVRLRFRRLADCAGLQPRQLAARLGDRRERRERQALLAALQPWLQSLGRLPFRADLPEAPEVIAAAAAFPAAMGLEQLLQLNLNQRLELYAALALEVPEAEWELHLRVITTHEQDAGLGYWHHEATLGQFLQRYAVLLGAPGAMPLQTQLPVSVKGAVQRHGGQSGVAAAVGLRYQGQLTGKNGRRTYWTEERLRDLLLQTEIHGALPAGAMPSKPQIKAFLASGVVPEYLDKQANTVFAALSRQSTLSWTQVAERFGRAMPERKTRSSFSLDLSRR